MVNNLDFSVLNNIGHDIKNADQHETNGDTSAEEQGYLSGHEVTDGEDVFYYIPAEEKDVSEYIMPKTCEKCGSDNLYIRVFFAKGIVRYVCSDCMYARSIPKQKNLKRRHGTRTVGWRMSVLKKYPKCFICGSSTDLEAHHIIPVEYSEDNIYNENNGITRCKKCHKMVHNNNRQNSRKE